MRSVQLSFRLHYGQDFHTCSYLFRRKEHPAFQFGDFSMSPTYTDANRECLGETVDVTKLSVVHNATRDHVRSGSKVVIPAAMRAVSGPRSF